jgi:hypothetical protein
MLIYQRVAISMHHEKPPSDDQLEYYNIFFRTDGKGNMNWEEWDTCQQWGISRMEIWPTMMELTHNDGTNIAIENGHRNSEFSH